MSAGQVLPGESPSPSALGTQDAPAESRSGRRRWGRLVGGLLVVLAVIAAGGGYWVWSNGKGDIDDAVAGDCVQSTSGDKGSSYRVVSCRDSKATHKALKLLPNGAAEDSCKVVPGASRSITNGSRTVCLGEKDIDPAKAVNAVKAGDCFGVQGSNAQRLDCSANAAEFKVLKRFTDVPAADARRSCAQVLGTESVYSWSWQSDGEDAGTGGGASGTTVDILLCLAKR